MAASPDLTIGYAAMLEQFHPTDVVDYSAYAEEHGFSGVMAADHFQPWVPQQGQAAFVWNVLTALGERTTGDIGPGVTAPTFRWHPAMVAQASATLAAMYPGRHWLGLGSGEALNEHVVADYWPEAPERSPPFGTSSARKGFCPGATVRCCWRFSSSYRRSSISRYFGISQSLKRPAPASTSTACWVDMAISSDSTTTRG
jgi:hypothetical protein